MNEEDDATTIEFFQSFPTFGEQVENIVKCRGLTEENIQLIKENERLKKSIELLKKERECLIKPEEQEELQPQRSKKEESLSTAVGLLNEITDDLRSALNGLDNHDFFRP